MVSTLVVLIVLRSASATPEGIKRPFSYPLGPDEIIESMSIPDRLDALGIVGTTPPLGPLSLRRYNPSELSEVGLIAGRLLEIVEAMHSIGVTHGFMRRSKFNYRTLSRDPTELVLVDISTCMLTSTGSGANTKLRWRDISSVIDSIISLIPPESREPLPFEILLMRQRFTRTHVSDNSIYAVLRGLAYRMSPPEGLIKVLSPYYHVLTTTELTAFSFAEGVGEDCPPSTISLGPGSLDKFKRISGIYGEKNLREYTAVSLRGRKVGVKYWSNSPTYPEPIIRERAVLNALREVPGVIRVNDLHSQGVSDACISRVIVHESSWGIISLNDVGPMSRPSVLAIARRGLKIITSVHAKGFIHGAIRADAWTLNFRRNPESLTLRFFSSARPWVVEYLGPPLPSQPVGDQSVFELEGHPPGRRSDMYRFAELLLRLSGEPDFAGWSADFEVSPALAARMKRARETGQSTSVPSCIVLFYHDVARLEMFERPAYTKYYQQFESCDE